MKDARAIKFKLKVGDLVSFAAITVCFALLDEPSPCSDAAPCVPCRARAYLNDLMASNDKRRPPGSPRYRYAANGSLVRQTESA